MRRSLAWLTVVAVTLIAARTSRADPRTSFMVEQLKTHEDYRVRTQAALALGASADDAAVEPLCNALLVDNNVSVRQSAAAALGKLAKPASAGCLKKAQAKETAGLVKQQIQKSIVAVESGGSAPPAIGPDTKFYVALQITNKTGRPSPEVEGLVRGAMQTRIISKKGYAVAPKTETVAQGRQIVRGKKLKGFFLIATLEAPIYEGGNLTQICRVSMWTYPDKALQGEFSPKFTQTGTSKGDRESEDALMKMCVENAVDTFHKVAASL